MENTKICHEALICGWEELTLGLKRNGKFDLEVFEKIFTETRLFFKGYPEENKINKEHIGLIVSAYKFAGADNDNYEPKYSAALVLTERMLNSVISDSSEADGVNIYILGARKDVYVDFCDVKAAVKKLSKYIEEDLYNLG